MTRRNSSLFCGVTFIFVVLLMASAAQAERYAFSGMWPSNPNSWYFDKPGGVAVDGSGNVYVADGGNNQVKVYDASSGSFVTSWGGFGSADGKFNGLKGVAVSGTDVYVVDTGNNRIQKFDSSGTYLTQWGSSGTGNSQFSSPAAIAVDTSGNVYVADTGNNRIQKFDSTGGHLATYGSAGTGNGEFASPAGLVVDTSANIFVADTGNNRVQKLDNTGAYASQFGTSGTADGQFAAPKGVAVDTLGNIYVADSNNNRIQKFTSAGVYSSKFGIIGGGNNQFIKPGGLAIDGSNLWVADTNNDRIIKSDTTFGTFTAWGSAGQGSGYFNEPGDVAFDDTGHAYVADSYNSLIQKFDLTFNPDGTLLNAAFASQWDGTESAGRDPAGQLYLPGRLLRDASGDILVADGGNSRIQKFDANGSFILEFGSAGSGDGQLATPCGLVLDADGNVFVADGGNPVSNDRVQKFTPVGAPGSVTAYNYASQFGTSGDGDGHDDPGQFDDPGGVVIDSRGFIYVVDTGNNRVQRFTSAGSFDFEWGGYGQGNGQFDYPRYIAIDGQDNIYVTDLQNDRVQKFTPVKTGETVTGYQYASQFGSTGNSEGKFNWPRGISFDPEGRVYVVDSHNDRIQVFLHMLDITTSAGTGGTITASTEVQEDKDKTITITPDTGYVVDDVLVDGSSVGAVTSYDFTNVQADHTISATFKVATFTLTPTAGENGSISPSTVVTVNYNGSQTFTMTPADGYEVADVLVDGSSVGAVTSYDFTGVVANHTISVTFQLQTFTITASAGTGGSISPEGEVSVNWGADQGFTITAGTGYNIADVLVDGSSVGAVGSYTFNDVTEGHTIAASFTQQTFTISTSTPGGHGTITPGGTVNYGDSFPVTITPDSGYQVLDVLVDGVSQGAITGYTFTDIQANHSISATFTPIMQTITASVTPANMGQISPSGSVQVAYGASQSFTITPNPGHRVTAVLVDTIDVGKVTSYQFANVTADHEIVAQFEQGTTSLAAIYLLLLGDQQVTLEALETDGEGQPLAQE